MTMPIIIRENGGRFTAAVGVHGWTKQIKGSYETGAEAEAAARETGEDLGPAVLVPAGVNAGDELRRREVEETGERLKTALPSKYGYAVEVTVRDCTPFAALAGRGWHPRRYGEALDRAVDQAPIHSSPRILWETKPGDPRLCRLTAAGRVLLDNLSTSGGGVVGGGVMMCGKWHRRSEGPDHDVHRDCPLVWWGGLRAGRSPREDQAPRVPGARVRRGVLSA